MTKNPTEPRGGRRQANEVKPRGTVQAMANQTPARRQDESLRSDVDLLEAVLERENLKRAWERVKANKGAAGIDGRSIAATWEWLKTAQGWSLVREQLRAGAEETQVPRLHVPRALEAANRYQEHRTAES